MSATFHRAQRASGVVGAGLATTVLPAISAGATSGAIRIIGKFQGDDRPDTPSGTRVLHDPSRRFPVHLQGPWRQVATRIIAHRGSAGLPFRTLPARSACPFRVRICAEASAWTLITSTASWSPVPAVRRGPARASPTTSERPVWPRRPPDRVGLGVPWAPRANGFLRRRIDHIQRHRAGHQLPIDQKPVIAHLSILEFGGRETARNHSRRARLQLCVLLWGE